MSKMSNHTAEARTPLVGLPEPSQGRTDAKLEENVSRSGYIETRNAAYRGFRSPTAANESLSKKLEM